MTTIKREAAAIAEDWKAAAPKRAALADELPIWAAVTAFFAICIMIINHGGVLF